MDPKDQDDIIKKIKTAGNNDDQNDNQDDSDDSNDGNSDGDSVSSDFGGDIGGGEQGNEDSDSAPVNEEDSIFLENPKKNNMFQPGSNNILDNHLKESKKSSIFDKIKSKLQETFNQEDEMSEPMVEPAVKPAPVKTPKKEPNIAPSRKNKPFLPMPDPSIKPDPKAELAENIPSVYGVPTSTLDSSFLTLDDTLKKLKSISNSSPKLSHAIKMEVIAIINQYFILT